MRIYATLLCVVLLLGIASAGHCQWGRMGVMNAFSTARWAGMGGAGIAAANDAAAVQFNPANLPRMQFDSADMGGPLTWGGTATYGSGHHDDLSVNAGVVGAGGKWGAGFSYERPSGSGWQDNIYGLGFGASADTGAWSWGVSATRDHEQCCGTWTWYNAGVLCAIPQPSGAPITAGLLVTNILEDDNNPRFYNVGVAVPVGERILLAADWWDITDEWWEHYNFGAEVAVAPGWCVRGGRLDEKWTAGVGFRQGRWSLDAAFIEMGWTDNWWLVSGSIPF